MKDYTLAIDLIKLIFAEFDKYAKNPEKSLSEMTVNELVEKQALQRSTAFVKSNLLYALNSFKFKKEDILELCKHIPELKTYIIDRNRSYRSDTRFDENDLKALKEN